MFRKIRRPAAVSYFFFCEVTARETSTRAAKPLAAMNEGVSLVVQSRGMG